jgi:hypothetical protein
VVRLAAPAASASNSLWDACVAVRFRGSKEKASGVAQMEKRLSQQTSMQHTQATALQIRCECAGFLGGHARCRCGLAWTADYPVLSKVYTPIPDRIGHWQTARPALSPFAAPLSAGLFGAGC